MTDTDYTGFTDAALSDELGWAEDDVRGAKTDQERAERAMDRADDELADTLAILAAVKAEVAARLAALPPKIEDAE